MHKGDGFFSQTSCKKAIALPKCLVRPLSPAWANSDFSVESALSFDNAR